LAAAAVLWHLTVALAPAIKILAVMVALSGAVLEGKSVVERRLLAVAVAVAAAQPEQVVLPPCGFCTKE
jgi:hypothetical protein